MAAQWSREQYEATLAGPTPARLVLVIDDGASIQGFLIARAVDKEWEIENLAVAPAAQRRGFGTGLLSEFLDLARARGAEAVFLEVRESNLAARRLYEKWAFLESARRKGYYRDPQEDAITYRFSFL
jgi:ribosomal-protein-alanine N-acetyltransferase